MKKNFFKYIINNFLKLFNLRLNRITLSNNFYYHIVKTLDFYNIDLVIDIGANKGQFGKEIREFGYKKKLISFEPMKSAFLQLKEQSKKYPLWEVENLGFGKETSYEFLNISKLKNLKHKQINLKPILESMTPQNGLLICPIDKIKKELKFLGLKTI